MLDTGMDPDDSKINDLLHDINTRVRLVEVELSGFRRARRIILGMAGFLILQALAAAVGWGKLITEVESINVSDIERDVGIALTVVADHGTELQDIRNEQARIRGVLDSIYKRLDERTKDRYYRAEAMRLEERVSRLENSILNDK